VRLNQCLEIEEGLSAHVHARPAVHHLPRLESNPNMGGHQIEWALSRALAGGSLKLPTPPHPDSLRIQPQAGRGRGASPTRGAQEGYELDFATMDSRAGPNRNAAEGAPLG
jgi:hypothetical protein